MASDYFKSHSNQFKVNKESTCNTYDRKQNITMNFYMGGR